MFPHSRRQPVCNEANGSKRGGEVAFRRTLVTQVASQPTEIHLELPSHLVGSGSLRSPEGLRQDFEHNIRHAPTANETFSEGNGRRKIHDNHPGAITFGSDLSDGVEVLDRRLNPLANSVEFDLNPPEVL